MSGPILTARSLAVSFGGRPAIENVDLTLRHSELVALVGPNGAGKSTLLAALAGTQDYSGVVLRCGCTGAQPAPGVAYLPQFSEVRAGFPLTAAQVVATGCVDARRWWRRPSPAQREAIAAALELLDITGLARTPFAQLSGGQARRVLLARALAQRPKVMLLDEPHAGLDTSAADTLNLALAAAAASGVAVLASVHDLGIARSAFDRAIVLHRSIVADGEPGAVLPASGGLPPWAVA